MLRTASTKNIRFKRTTNGSSTVSIGSGTFYWLRRPEGWTVFAFACASMFLHGYGQLRLLGFLMVLCFPVVHYFRLAQAFRRMLPVPPELKFYSAWVVWAGLTGIFVAADRTFFWEGYRVVLQMIIMVWTLYAILRNLGKADVILLAITTGGLIQIAAVLTGLTDVTSIAYTGERQTGLTQNPNTVGFMMVWTILCALSFWNSGVKGRVWIRTLILALIPPAAYVIMASGSRKSLFALAFVLISWAVFASSPARGFKGYGKRMLITSMSLLIIIQVQPFIVEYTPVGKRLKDFFDKGQGSVEAAMEQNVRYWMYVEGIRLFVENPIVGVGLNNFKVHYYTGQYSHSDYIEPLATTGAIGFLLYQAFYLCLVWRCFKLIRSVKDPHAVYCLKMIFIGVATIMLLGIAAPHYTSQPVFILLTAFSVYSWQFRENPLPVRRSIGWSLS